MTSSVHCGTLLLVEGLGGSGRPRYDRGGSARGAGVAKRHSLRGGEDAPYDPWVLSGCGFRRVGVAPGQIVGRRRNGRRSEWTTTATIIVAKDVTEPAKGKLQTAAEELQAYAEDGASLPIVDDGQDVEGPVILVGRSRLSDVLGGRFPPECVLIAATRVS